VRFIKDFRKNHPFLFKLALVVIFAAAITVIFSVLSAAMASGGNEWNPLWQKVQDYITGVPGKIAATFLVAASIFAFYRGMLAQGGVAILAATGLVLSPKIANAIANGALF